MNTTEQNDKIFLAYMLQEKNEISESKGSDDQHERMGKTDKIDSKEMNEKKEILACHEKTDKIEFLQWFKT